jgi:hypothetical protein
VNAYLQLWWPLYREFDSSKNYTNPSQQVDTSFFIKQRIMRQMLTGFTYYIDILKDLEKNEHPQISSYQYDLIKNIFRSIYRFLIYR